MSTNELLLICGLVLAGAEPNPPPRPNVLWITSEDHGPHLGCYGDTFAVTPNVDRLAAKGVIYTRVWSCAPVCAPARTTLISGMYPTSTGSEHMRSMAAYPTGKQMFPQLLRAAGYYCTNNAKEDYNLTQPGRVWDESSREAHWRNRAAGQPFFAVFNSEKSHESQIRKRPHRLLHDPANVRVPEYHPDTPEVRHDWAQYYDGVSEADADAGARLREIEEAGLADSTIVFYFADHGSGMPRSKRWPYNSGLQVPLVVFIPEAFRALRPAEYAHGGKIDRLVSFVDFAPTVLSLAAVEPPDWMQGHAFLGAFAAAPSPLAFGFRGRMDERYDLVRSATDGRYVYVRNYMPHRMYGQHVAYMFETPTTQVWQRLHGQGRLTAAQDAFWKAKAPEELFDLTTDPEEVKNLASSPEYQMIAAKLRDALRAWILRVRDVGFLPEGEILSRSAGSTPYDMGHDETRYPLERILATAELASSANIEATGELQARLKDRDSAVRYWGALGLLMRKHAAVASAHAAIVAALEDSSPYVRTVAAETLASYGDLSDQKRGLSLLSELANPSHDSPFVVMAALNALDALGPSGMHAKAPLRSIRPSNVLPDARYSSYIPRLLEKVD